MDVYVGPHRASPRVFVVDQKDADTGRFDEHKAFIGFSSAQQVTKVYHAAFSDGRGPERLGHLVEMPIDAFKRWIANGDTTKPAAQDRAQGGRVATEKLSHKAVGYISHSRLPGKHCSVCSMYLSGSHCPIFMVA